VNYVLTSLLTSSPDPQRGVKWPADPSVLDALIGSVDGAECVVFVDEIDDERFIRVPAGGNPYYYRWHLVRDWLIAHPDARYVWAVDGSDVEMLREPWGEMHPGVLYVGSEPHPVHNEWMIYHHPETRGFIAAHSNHRLLNSGIAGGDRDTLLEFTTRLCNRLDQVDGTDNYDMGAFNQVAWSAFAGRMVTGERVHTIFRLDDRSNQFAWWKHK
jgi:hypothetical protein